MKLGTAPWVGFIGLGLVPAWGYACGTAIPSEERAAVVAPPSSTESVGQRQALLTAARVLRQAGRLDDAVELIRREREKDAADEALYLEYLTIQDLRGQLTAEEAAALEALRAQVRAESEQAVGAVRLGLLRARARLAQGQPDEAVRAAEAALARIDPLPEGVDRASLRKPLETVLAEARAARARAAGASNLQPELPRLSDIGSLPQEEQDAGQEDEETVPPPPSGAVVEASSVPGPPRPFGERVDMAIGLRTPLEQIDAENLAYQQSQLMRMGEHPQLWDRVVTYPPCWPELTRRRSASADGLLYRGPEFVAEDGKVKYTAIYDTADLLADVPHFNSAPVLDLHTLLQAGADRAALRQSSDIFTGTPADLAAGLPLLGYFGGLDEYHAPPASRGTQYQIQDLLRMVEDVLREK